VTLSGHLFALTTQEAHFNGSVHIHFLFSIWRVFFKI